MLRHRSSLRHVGHLGPRAATVTLACALVLSACGGDENDDAGSDPEALPGFTTPDDPVDDEVEVDDDDEPTTDGGGDAPADEAAGAPPLAGDASTDDRQQDPVDAALSLVDVRIGTHDGFDRVVFELVGDGQVGWYLTSDAEAISHGSGDEVDVAGDAVLTVDLVGVLYPMDAPAGVTTFETTHVGAPGGAAVVTEVINNQIYEGHHQLFIGLREPAAYRIERLDDPQRLAIDILHP